MRTCAKKVLLDLTWQTHLPGGHMLSALTLFETHFAKVHFAKIHFGKIQRKCCQIERGRLNYHMLAALTRHTPLTLLTTLAKYFNKYFYALC